MDAARRKVLLVEDEYLIQLLVEDALAALGCDVGDSATTLGEATRAAQDGDFAFALVDLDLAGARTYPVAEILAARRIPFAFMTGYRSEDLDPVFAGTPLLAKPFRRADIAAIVAVLGGAGKPG